MGGVEEEGPIEAPEARQRVLAPRMGQDTREEEEGPVGPLHGVIV